MRISGSVLFPHSLYTPKHNPRGWRSSRHLILILVSSYAQNVVSYGTNRPLIFPGFILSPWPILVGSAILLGSAFYANKYEMYYVSTKYMLS